MFVCTWVKLGIDESQGVMEWSDTAPSALCVQFTIDDEENDDDNHRASRQKNDEA